MIFQKIWEKYFIKEFIRIFFLFLFCFYGLYILIDYASHTSSFANSSLSLKWADIAKYYLFIFASRAEILIPLALLIAFVYNVTTLNARHELVAFMASGFSIKFLMKPFLIFGLFCVFLNYVNEQFLLPSAFQSLRKIEDSSKHQRSKRAALQSAKHLLLEDGTLLVFQDFDTAHAYFFDAYWIQSIDSIYRIKTLSPETAPPIGHFIDHLVRDESGKLLQKAAYKALVFPSMKFNQDLLHSAIMDPDALSLTELVKEIKKISKDPDEKESKILTAFYWKIMLPWLSLLAIIAPAPFCVRYSRRLPIFLIYIISLFGLISLYMFMDAAQVIAKRQVLDPFLAICVPFLAFFAFFSSRFAMLKSS